MSYITLRIGNNHRTANVVSKHSWSNQHVNSTDMHASMCSSQRECFGHGAKLRTSSGREAGSFLLSVRPLPLPYLTGQGNARDDLVCRRSTLGETMGHTGLRGALRDCTSSRAQQVHDHALPEEEVASQAAWRQGCGCLCIGMHLA